MTKSLFDPATLLGKAQDEAKQICENFGYRMRVTSKNGESLCVTADYRTDRINIGVTNGNVSSINGIG